VIHAVVLSARARKQLLSIPEHVSMKLAAWVEAVEVAGLETVRKVSGFHDEPLKGSR
jgi:toxin HigB-1